MKLRPVKYNPTKLNLSKPGTLASDPVRPVDEREYRFGKNPASEVWLLAASTGGLQAVRQFLAQVNPSSGLGFIYAQHIDVEHEGQLVKLVERHSQWKAEIACVGAYVKEGCVTVISPGEKVSISRDGDIISSDRPWSSQYRPCIDDICGELSAGYQQHCGMIVFTGMGDDGVKGSKTIDTCGGQVWVQAPESCTVAALPEAIQARGECHFSADINGLTNRFNQYLNGSLSRRRLEVSDQ